MAFLDVDKALNIESKIFNSLTDDIGVSITLK